MDLASIRREDTSSVASTDDEWDSRVPIVACVASQETRLVGAREIRLRLGIRCRQRLYKLARRRDFPAPVAVLAQGKVWLLSEVEDWIGRHRAKPG